MFFVKNVPGLGRVIRVLMGIALVGLSLAYFGATVQGWGFGIAGAMAVMTGLLGFCPACAMVGRRLKH